MCAYIYHHFIEVGKKINGGGVEYSTVYTYGYDEPEDDYDRNSEDLEDIVERENESRAYNALSTTAAVIVVLLIIIRLIWTILAFVSGVEKGQMLALIMETVIFCLVAFGGLTFIAALCEYFEDVHIIRLQGSRRR